VKEVKEVKSRMPMRQGKRMDVRMFGCSAAQPAGLSRSPHFYFFL